MEAGMAWWFGVALDIMALIAAMAAALGATLVMAGVLLASKTSEPKGK